MRVDLFDFDLPEKFIAKEPVAKRDEAKLLLVPSLENRQVKDLVDILPADSLIVFNNTKVIPARIFGVCRERHFEATLHKNIALGTWLAFIRNSKKLNVGDEISFGDGLLIGTVKSKQGESGVELCFNKSGHEFFDVLEKIGTLPLPPYLKREVKKEDFENYQTVYAKVDGAVAAPTAGLHFTEELLQKLKAKGIDMVELTLHVGAGTFQPVKVEDTKDHKMHSEYVVISKEVADKINDAKKAGKKIIGVGTTVLRSLESAVDSDGWIHPFSRETDIFITPPYTFKSVDYLMTNFHLPKSTLFMLVCAFAGMDEMKKAYEFAKENNYRFYSYGDASLLKRKDS
ncbi:MAG: tRNA preQ1(34) S-adenosylmethionine ribosyltransferase-isomerase QueA [Alphaproteobacteria bacterium]|nr:tRNA preQ1(34) S-adenosylmethionine ribosyltransferase-isomerase QueA [Alphaproteobacteria bacterium]